MPFREPGLGLEIQEVGGAWCSPGCSNRVRQCGTGGKTSRIIPREVSESGDNGFPWQASIGATAQRMVFVDRGEAVEVNGRKFSGPLYVAQQSTGGSRSWCNPRCCSYRQRSKSPPSNCFKELPLNQVPDTAAELGVNRGFLFRGGSLPGALLNTGGQILFNLVGFHASMPGRFCAANGQGSPRTKSAFVVEEAQLNRCRQCPAKVRSALAHSRLRRFAFRIEDFVCQLRITIDILRNQ